MNETSIPLHKLLAAVLWSITGLMLLAAWLVYFAGYADLGVMLAATAGSFALGGATATARTWAICIVRMMRLTGTQIPSVAQSRGMRSVKD